MNKPACVQDGRLHVYSHSICQPAQCLSVNSYRRVYAKHMQLLGAEVHSVCLWGPWVNLHGYCGLYRVTSGLLMQYLRDDSLCDYMGTQQLFKHNHRSESNRCVGAWHWMKTMCIWGCLGAPARHINAFNYFVQSLCPHRAGDLKLRPVGHTWPAKVIYPARLLGPAPPWVPLLQAFTSLPSRCHQWIIILNRLSG